MKTPHRFPVVHAVSTPTLYWQPNCFVLFGQSHCVTSSLPCKIIAVIWALVCRLKCHGTRGWVYIHRRDLRGVGGTVEERLWTGPGWKIRGTHTISDKSFAALGTRRCIFPETYGRREQGAINNKALLGDINTIIIITTTTTIIINTIIIIKPSSQ